MRRASRRHFTLLEVMISLALIVLCILPLIYPHVALYKAQSAFVNEMKVDRLVQRLYAEMLVKLYRGEVSWSEVEGEKAVEIDAGQFEKEGIPKGYFKGSYRWKIEHYKPTPPAERTAYLLELDYEIAFTQENRPPLHYLYQIFVERVLAKGEKE